MQSNDISASPERRSAADLQRILDSLIGDDGFVLSRNLPSGESLRCCSSRLGRDASPRSRRLTRPVLLAYEQEHDLVILDTHDHEGLQLLCSQHDDLELGPQDVFNFLTWVTPQLPSSLRLSSQDSL
jgi:hypothetical protein